MSTRDLNLLTTLDVLLAERSVTAAARRLGLSPSATSRALARLRSATGDPLLVQAGRRLVLTPHAEALAARVGEVTHEAAALLSPSAARFDPARLERAFTIRANEGFTALFAARLVTRIATEAPGVRLRFAPKADKDAAPIRSGAVDVEIGVTGTSAPEMRTQLIFRDLFVGAVRNGHPLLGGRLTPERYAACDHVVASRRGAVTGPVDDALARLGLTRRVVAIAPGFPDALRIARHSDLIALASRACFRAPACLAEGLTMFDLPISTPEISISAMWHPRLDADAGHRWMRGRIVELCRLP